MSRNRAAARAWRIAGGCVVAAAAAALGTYALLGWQGGSDLPATSDRLDAAVGAAPSAKSDGPSDAISARSSAFGIAPQSRGPGNGAASPPPTAGEATRIGAFADPDASGEQTRGAPIHIGEYIDADDDSPKPSAAGPGRRIGPPLDPDA